MLGHRRLLLQRTVADTAAVAQLDALPEHAVVVEVVVTHKRGLDITHYNTRCMKTRFARDKLTHSR